MSYKELSDMMATIVTEDGSEHYKADVLTRVKQAYNLFLRRGISDAKKKSALNDAVEAIDRKNILHLILFFFDEALKLKKSGRPAKWRTNAISCLQEAFIKLGIKISIGGEEVKESEILVSGVRSPHGYFNWWQLSTVCRVYEDFVLAENFELPNRVSALYDLIGTVGGHDCIGKHQILGRFSFI